jgi:hypothetical protein
LPSWQQKSQADSGDPDGSRQTKEDPMTKLTIITRLGFVLEAARFAGDFRRAQRCRRALRLLGAVA